MSNIHLYSDQVQWNVTSILANIYERGGLAGTKFLQSEYQRLLGEWPADVINIAMLCIGRDIAFEGVASEKQMSIFVEQAKQHNAILLRKIAELRAAKGK